MIHVTEGQSDDNEFRFVVVDRQGTRCASAEHIEEATTLMRALPIADRVLEAHTGVTMAYKRHRLLPRLTLSVPS